MTNWWGLPRGYGEQGNNVIYFRGTGEHKSKNKGNRGTHVILGSSEHRKLRVWYWGTRENANIFQGNKGIGTPLGLIDDIFLFFFFFSKIIGFDISCKYFPNGPIYMKCRTYFLEKKKENISKCRLPNISLSVVIVKGLIPNISSNRKACEDGWMHRIQAYEYIRTLFPTTRIIFSNNTLFYDTSHIPYGI